MCSPLCLCGSREFATVFTYHAPPLGEVRFDFGAAPYFREILRCDRCGHFLSVHQIDMRALYSGQYVNATYGADGLKRAFDRIISLPEERSDNVGRVAAVKAFATTGARRDLLLPNVPTGREAGLEGLEIESWFGLFAPARAPAAAIEHLRSALEKATEEPVTRKRLESGGWRIISMTPAETSKYLAGDVERWTKFLRQTGVKAE